MITSAVSSFWAHTICVVVCLAFAVSGISAETTDLCTSAVSPTCGECLAIHDDCVFCSSSFTCLNVTEDIDCGDVVLDSGECTCSDYGSCSDCFLDDDCSWCATTDSCVNSTSATCVDDAVVLDDAHCDDVCGAFDGQCTVCLSIDDCVYCSDTSSCMNSTDADVGDCSLLAIDGDGCAVASPTPTTTATVSSTSTLTGTTTVTSTGSSSSSGTTTSTVSSTATLSVSSSSSASISSSLTSSLSVTASPSTTGTASSSSSGSTSPSATETVSVSPSSSGTTTVSSTVSSSPSTTVTTSPSATITPSASPAVNCSQATSCSQCMDVSEDCLFCASTGACVNGTEEIDADVCGTGNVALVMEETLCSDDCYSQSGSSCFDCIDYDDDCGWCDGYCVNVTLSSSLSTCPDGGSNLAGTDDDCDALTATPTPTSSVSSSSTVSATGTSTSSLTVSASSSVSGTATASTTGTVSGSSTVSSSATVTATATVTNTISPSISVSVTATSTPSTSASVSVTATASTSASVTVTVTPSATAESASCSELSSCGNCVDSLEDCVYCPIRGECLNASQSFAECGADNIGLVYEDSVCSDDCFTKTDSSCTDCLGFDEDCGWCGGHCVNTSLSSSTDFCSSTDELVVVVDGCTTPTATITSTPSVTVTSTYSATASASSSLTSSATSSGSPTTSSTISVTETGTLSLTSSSSLTVTVTSTVSGTVSSSPSTTVSTSPSTTIIPSASPAVNCSQATSCTQCMDVSEDCLFCASTGTCVNGTEEIDADVCGTGNVALVVEETFCSDDCYSQSGSSCFDCIDYDDDCGWCDGYCVNVTLSSSLSTCPDGGSTLVGTEEACEPTPSPSPTVSSSPSSSSTVSVTSSISPSASVSTSPSMSGTVTSSSSGTQTVTQTVTLTGSVSATSTYSPTATDTGSVTISTTPSSTTSSSSTLSTTTSVSCTLSATISSSPSPSVEVSECEAFVDCTGCLANSEDCAFCPINSRCYNASSESLAGDACGGENIGLLMDDAMCGDSCLTQTDTNCSVCLEYGDGDCGWCGGLCVNTSLSASVGSCSSSLYVVDEECIPTSSSTPSATVSATVSLTPSASPTSSMSSSSTASPTTSSSLSASSSGTVSPTLSTSVSSSPSGSSSTSSSVSVTSSATVTSSESVSLTETATATVSVTASQTVSATPSGCVIATTCAECLAISEECWFCSSTSQCLNASDVSTAECSGDVILESSTCFSPTSTPSTTVSTTVSPSVSVSPTLSSTLSSSSTVSASASTTATVTASVSSSASGSPSATSSSTASSSVSTTVSSTTSSSVSASSSGSSTVTVSVTISGTVSATTTSTVSETQTVSATVSVTTSVTPTTSATTSITPTATYVPRCEDTLHQISCSACSSTEGCAWCEGIAVCVNETALDESYRCPGNTSDSATEFGLGDVRQCDDSCRLQYSTCGSCVDHDVSCSFCRLEGRCFNHTIGLDREVRCTDNISVASTAFCIDPDLSLSAENVSILEGGLVAFNISLTTPPSSGAVVLDILGASSVTASEPPFSIGVTPSQLSFTSLDFNTERLVTIMSVDNTYLLPASVSPISTQVSLVLVEGPAEYEAFVPSSSPVGVLIIEDDVPELLSSVSHISLRDGDGQANITLSLSGNPNVTIMVSPQWFDADDGVSKIAVPNRTAIELHQWDSGANVVVALNGEFILQPGEYERHYTLRFSVLSNASHVFGNASVSLGVTIVAPCPNGCSGHGTCNPETGRCTCNSGWYGDACLFPNCSSVRNCSWEAGRGTCVGENTCHCKPGWVGRSCSITPCVVYRNCRQCVATSGCGWIASQRICVPGDVSGPYSHFIWALPQPFESIPALQDRLKASWFYHSCVSHRDHGCDTGSQIRRLSCRSSCQNSATNTTCAVCNSLLDCYENATSDCPSVARSSSVCRQSLSSAGRDFFSALQTVPVCGDFFCDAQKGESCSSCPGDCGRCDAMSVSSTCKANCDDVYDVFSTASLLPFCDVLPVGSHANNSASVTCCAELRTCYATCGRKKSVCDAFFTQCIADGCSLAFQNASNTLTRQSCDPKLRLIQAQLGANCEEYRLSQCRGCNVSLQTSKLCSANGHLVQLNASLSTCMCYKGWGGPRCNRMLCPRSSLDTARTVCSGRGVCLPSVSTGQPVCSCEPSFAYTGDACELPRNYSVLVGGDPFYSTFDGLRYMFNGIGQYTYCRHVESGFLIQHRLFATSNRRGSFLGQLAVRMSSNEPVVSVLASNGRNTAPTIKVNGATIARFVPPATGSFFSERARVSDTIEVALRRITGTTFSAVIYHDSGIVIRVSQHYISRSSRGFLNMIMIVPAPVFLNGLEGMCGTLDGSASNDLRSPLGTEFQAELGSLMSGSAIDSFANAWKQTLTSNSVNSVGGLSPVTAMGGLVTLVDDGLFSSNDPVDSQYTLSDYTPTNLADFNGQNQSSAFQTARDFCIQNIPSATEAEIIECVVDSTAANDTSVVLQQERFTQTCENDCSQHGFCSNGTCECSEGWEGSICNVSVCDPLCNSTGSHGCVDGFCSCRDGYLGQSCSETADCSTVKNCSGNGVCVDHGSCRCNSGYTGLSCSVRATCFSLSDCSGHGTCVGTDKCDCEEGYTGDACTLFSCEALEFCSGNGQCNELDVCTCNSGWVGESCSTFECSAVLNCSGQGQCIGPNECSCTPGFEGDDCSQSIASCPCSSNTTGVCVSSTLCDCFSGWTGTNCSDPDCSFLGFCGGNGECIAPNECECASGYSGERCETPTCTALQECSGHGSCVDVELCECDAGWEGSACNVTRCGDGVHVTGSEGCDDGNLKSGDGCSSACQVEACYACATTEGQHISSCSPICGDGLVCGGEECDTGSSGEVTGCNASSCLVLSGYVCTGQGASTQCSGGCGDGSIATAFGEKCDDGNNVNGDGCSRACQIETGFFCGSEPSTCTSVCGDGSRASVEECDDGNTDAGDGCSSKCKVETGFVCIEGEGADVCSTVCGDGQVISGVDTGVGYCDDGNTKNGDGCSGSCQVEQGWTCAVPDAGQSSVCEPVCGDGRTRGVESCDDGGLVDGDGCSSQCVTEPNYRCVAEVSGGTTACRLIVREGVLNRTVSKPVSQLSRLSFSCAWSPFGFNSTVGLVRYEAALYEISDSTELGMQIVGFSSTGTRPWKLFDHVELLPHRLYTCSVRAISSANGLTYAHGIGLRVGGSSSDTLDRSSIQRPRFRPPNSADSTGVDDIEFTIPAFAGATPGSRMFFTSYESVLLSSSDVPAIDTDNGTVFTLPDPEVDGAWVDMEASGLVYAGTLFEVDIVDSSTEAPLDESDSASFFPMKLSLPFVGFRNSSNDDLIDVYLYDVGVGRWMRAVDSCANSSLVSPGVAHSGNRVTVDVCHFTVFALAYSNSGLAARSPSEDGSDSDSNAAIIGGVSGAAVVSLVALLFTAYYYRRRRQRDLEAVGSIANLPPGARQGRIGLPSSATKGLTIVPFSTKRGRNPLLPVSPKKSKKSKGKASEHDKSLVYVSTAASINGGGDVRVVPESPRTPRSKVVPMDAFSSHSPEHVMRSSASKRSASKGSLARLVSATSLSKFFRGRSGGASVSPKDTGAARKSGTGGGTGSSDAKSSTSYGRQLIPSVLGSAVPSEATSSRKNAMQTSSVGADVFSGVTSVADADVDGGISLAEASALFDSIKTTSASKRDASFHAASSLSGVFSGSPSSPDALRFSSPKQARTSTPLNATVVAEVSHDDVGVDILPEDSVSNVGVNAKRCSPTIAMDTTPTKADSDRDDEVDLSDVDVHEAEEEVKPTSIASRRSVEHLRIDVAADNADSSASQSAAPGELEEPDDDAPELTDEALTGMESRLDAWLASIDLEIEESNASTEGSEAAAAGRSHK